MPKSKKYLVYMHTAPSGKVYIGITSRTAKKRWGSNGCNYTSTMVFYNAIKKYGWENIVHEVLAIGLNETDAKQLEIDLIDKYQSRNPRYGYNRTFGGDGVRGYTPSEATIAKLREISRGNNNAAGHKMPDWQLARNYGNKYALGCTRSEETRAKMSANRKQKRAVTQIDINTGDEVAIYESIKLASKIVNGNRENITACCRGRQHTAYGYMWQYARGE